MIRVLYGMDTCRVLCALLEKPHCQQNAKMFYFETIIMVALWDVTPNIEIIFGEFTFLFVIHHRHQKEYYFYLCTVFFVLLYVEHLDYKSDQHNTT